MLRKDICLRCYNFHYQSQFPEEERMSKEDIERLWRCGNAPCYLYPNSNRQQHLPKKLLIPIPKWTPNTDVPINCYVFMEHTMALTVQV